MGFQKNRRGAGALAKGEFGVSKTRDSRLIRIAGKTGEGVDSAGDILAHIAKESGLEVNTFRSFPPVIKGGNTHHDVRIGVRPVLCSGDDVDVLIALDGEQLARLKRDVAEDGWVLYDRDAVRDVPERKNWVGLPLKSTARSVGAPVMRNMVALGAVTRLAGLDGKRAAGIIRARFAAKGERVAEENRRAFEAGYRMHEPRMKPFLPRMSEAGAKEKDRLFLSGNEAMAFGALAADCKLFAGYPITPATDIMEWLAVRLPRFGGDVVQTEDEIAALCMVIGAQYAGVRAMTATSGPGISLMTEALGLSGMTETPAVIVNVQRPGPSAGMPTKHEQGDIQHMIFASHGEFSRIVLAPGTIGECFRDIVAAFHLADRHQCPVLVASDQDLALRKQTIDPSELDPENIAIDRGKLAAPGDGFRRYACTDDGISPRAFPGQEGMLFLASGDEHDEEGKIDVEIPEVRRRMVEKRMRKIRRVESESLRWYGNPAAHRVLVGCGSVTGVALEVLRRAPDWKFVQIRRLWPFPAREVEAALRGAERVAVAEHNEGGQLARLIRSELPIHERLRSIRKYDGTPFKPRELWEAMQG
jgi:2-oxoglutarate ferredoxin oxidoreductase subunit alpha